ncbi:hypothetical protein LSS_22230 [Leptospira santarosai serovar Shermani str. LT 821]|uniref:Uncharacterized protein n=1 Tax=Leptospira santarosai serovar Shermani str. LT 821 TaxID=758847 RepID=A0A097EST8_9LEPT|nr:hypothetical protein LSS_22230 [Leptospira santarosai serovar Shermani str. LT 821]
MSNPFPTDLIFYINCYELGNLKLSFSNVL